MTRVYYWFRGAPADRPGGPWHYRDFLTRKEAEEFLKDCLPVLCKVAITSNIELMPEHDPMRIAPHPSLVVEAKEWRKQ